jgi:hypothetical protein
VSEVTEVFSVITLLQSVKYNYFCIYYFQIPLFWMTLEALKNFIIILPSSIMFDKFLRTPESGYVPGAHAPLSIAEVLWTLFIAHHSLQLHINENENRNSVVELSRSSNQFYKNFGTERRYLNKNFLKSIDKWSMPIELIGLWLHNRWLRLLISGSGSIMSHMRAAVQKWPVYSRETMQRSDEIMIGRILFES